MSGAKRKVVDPMEEEGDNSEHSSGGEDEIDMYEYVGDEEVKVDFEGRNAIDPDCHGIAQLLKRLLEKCDINCMELADVIIAQNYVGSVISQCLDSDDTDEEDASTVFGVSTVLNLTEKKSIPCIEQLWTFIADNANKFATSDALTKFDEAMNTAESHVGLIINERFINIPIQIAVPTFDTLVAEINDAVEKEMPFKFDHFIMILKCYRRLSTGEIVYTNEEEALFESKSLASFDVMLATETNDKAAGDVYINQGDMVPFRKIILLRGDSFPLLVKELPQFIKK